MPGSWMSISTSARHVLGGERDRGLSGDRLERACSRSAPQDVAEELHVLVVVLDDEDSRGRAVMPTPDQAT